MLVSSIILSLILATRESSKVTGAPRAAVVCDNEGSYSVGQVYPGTVSGALDAHSMVKSIERVVFHDKTLGYIIMLTDHSTYFNRSRRARFSGEENAALLAFVKAGTLHERLTPEQFKLIVSDASTRAAYVPIDLVSARHAIKGITIAKCA